MTIFTTIINKLMIWVRKVFHMTQGLEIYGEKGELIVSMTDRLTQVIGVKRLTFSQKKGSIVVPNVNNNTIWFTTNVKNIMFNPYIIWIDGNTIHYQIRDDWRSYFNEVKAKDGIINLVYGVC